MERNFTSVLAAQNATETVKSLIDTILVPQGVTKLVEIGWQIVMAGMTTLESASNILEIESDDATGWGGTQQFASPVMIPLTEGIATFPCCVHDCDISVSPGSHLKMSSTFNVALTINPSIRVFGKFR
jgi:hypothetical protein